MSDLRLLIFSEQRSRKGITFSRQLISRAPTSRNSCADSDASVADTSMDKNGEVWTPKAPRFSREGTHFQTAVVMRLGLPINDGRLTK
jgi:hypothetical protein